jgi:hypothetical protein
VRTVSIYLPDPTTRPFDPVTKPVSRLDNVYTSVLGIIGFITTQPIRPISSLTSHWVSQWYRDSSLVYVSQVHSLWKKDGRASKRYGRLIRSQKSVLNVMMKAHQAEVTDWMAAKQQELAATMAENDDEAEGEDDDDQREEEGREHDHDPDPHDRSEDEDLYGGGHRGRESDGDTINDPTLGDAAAGTSGEGGYGHTQSHADPVSRSRSNRDPDVYMSGP